MSRTAQLSWGNRTIRIPEVPIQGESRSMRRAQDYFCNIFADFVAQLSHILLHRSNKGFDVSLHLFWRKSKLSDGNP